MVLASVLKYSALNRLQSRFIFKKLSPTPANKYGDSLVDCRAKLFFNRSATNSSEISKTGVLKLKFLCCLYSGTAYFESSPFDFPKERLVRNENMGSITLLRKI